MHPACIVRLEKSMTGNTSKTVLKIIRNLYNSTSLSSLTYDDLTREIAYVADKSVNNTDSRISHLEFSNFRTFPSNEERRYVVNFKKNDCPASLFLIGQNGTGKSTLFTALEKIYLGYSSFAADTGVSENDYLTFSFNRDPEKRNCRWGLEYTLGNGNLEKPIHVDGNDKALPLSVPAFICSDLDISKARKEDKLFKWILKELGYSEIGDMRTLLESMRSYHVDVLKAMKNDTYLSDNDKWELIKAINDINCQDDIEEIKECNNENNIKTRLSGNFFKDIWKNMVLLSGGSESGVEIPNDIRSISYNDSDVKRLVKLYRKLWELIHDNFDFSLDNWKYGVIEMLISEQGKNVDITKQDEKEIKAKIKNIEKANRQLQDFEKEVVWEFISKYGNEIELLLKDFSSHKEQYHFINTDRDYIQNLTLNIGVNLRGSFNTVPKEYFNTFRYKLFVQTMKMALAFNWMKDTGIAAPIVIDDVFNASDFENSIKLESYIFFVKRMYRRICLDNNFQHKLQLVLLTHDDIVFNSVVNGFNMVRIDENWIENNPEKYPFIKGRLYKLEELDVLYERDGQEEETHRINVFNELG